MHVSLPPFSYPQRHTPTTHSTAVGNGSLIPQMEWASGYAVKWAEMIAMEDIHSMDPKQDAIDDFNVYTQ